MYLACAYCGTVNRVPQERLMAQPICGHCKAELMAASPVALSDQHFATFIERTDLPVLVDFWADWCGPCKMMAPQFEAAAREMPMVRFAKVDTEAHPKASVSNRIRSIPTMVLYQAGREVARRSGAVGSQDLQRWLREQLAQEA